jgi:hypothetical protein
MRGDFIFTWRAVAEWNWIEHATAPAHRGAFSANTAKEQDRRHGQSADPQTPAPRNARRANLMGVPPLRLGAQAARRFLAGPRHHLGWC